MRDDHFGAAPASCQEAACGHLLSDECDCEELDPTPAHGIERSIAMHPANFTPEHGWTGGPL
jgi:hypothetical protein